MTDPLLIAKSEFFKLTKTAGGYILHITDKTKAKVPQVISVKLTLDQLDELEKLLDYTLFDLTDGWQKMEYAYPNDLWVDLDDKLLNSFDPRDYK